MAPSKKVVAGPSAASCLAELLDDPDKPMNAVSTCVWIEVHHIVIHHRHHKIIVDTDMTIDIKRCEQDKEQKKVERAEFPLQAR